MVKLRVFNFLYPCRFAMHHGLSLRISSMSKVSDGDTVIGDEVTFITGVPSPPVTSPLRSETM